MSETSPTQIIAEHAVKYTEFDDVAVCACGGRFFDDASDYTQADEDRGIVRHSAHVVSKLTDAGYSIVPIPTLDELDCVSATPNSGKVRCYLDDPRMDVDDARSLAGLLLAAATVAEGEKP